MFRVLLKTYNRGTFAPLSVSDIHLRDTTHVRLLTRLDQSGSCTFSPCSTTSDMNSPCGTVTSLPSMVKVMSACLGLVEANDRAAKVSAFPFSALVDHLTLRVGSDTSGY
jgi:hypothetical protein